MKLKIEIEWDTPQRPCISYFVPAIHMYDFHVLRRIFKTESNLEQHDSELSDQ